MTDGREEPSASYKLGNGWVILHWCANLTIILTGFTFIPARINAQPDGQVFIVWAIVQVAVLVVLGMASQFAVMRPLSMENWASPLRMCVLFLAGIAWYFAAHAIVPALGGFWLIETIPSAVLLSVASAMGFLYIVDYCRATSETDFWKHAVPGSLISAFVVFFPIERFPLVGSALCCLVSLVWYIAHRRLSSSLTEYETVLPEGAEDRRRLPMVLGSTTALLFAGGMICPIVMNPTSLASASYTMLYILSLLSLTIILTITPALGCLRSIYSYAKVCVVLSALAYCFLVFAGDALVGATAAVLLGAFTVNVSMMFYVLSQCLGDPRVRSLRFWGAALLVFLAFFLGIALASMAIHASGDRDIDRFVVLSLCSYLFFIVCFRESWSFQKPQALAVKRITVTPLLTNSLENELHGRCQAIADVYQLTDRETEVLTCLSEGWSIPAAAQRLMVSQDTVRTHVKHIYAKIGIHSRDDLVEIIKMPDESLLPKSG